METRLGELEMPGEKDCEVWLRRPKGNVRWLLGRPRHERRSQAKSRRKERDKRELQESRSAQMTLMEERASKKSLNESG